MAFYTEALGISNNAFLLLRDLIHQRTGLFYELSKRELLESKLSSRLIERGFTSFLDYYYLLKYDPAAHGEWEQLVNVLSVQETFFWREIDAVEALVREIVPRWAREHPGEVLRIWSAACATGEEPLTIAMALHEEGWFKRIPIDIYASDGSSAAIAAARRGVYRERAFRNLPGPLRARYFVETADGWRVVPELHSRVRWATANLMSAEAVAPLANAPVIFCRNVFLYFSLDSIRITVGRFAEHMPSPAYLFIGVAESLLRVATPFRLQEIGTAFVYVK